MDHKTERLSCATPRATAHTHFQEALDTMIAVDPPMAGFKKSPSEWTREDLIEKVQNLNPSANIDYLMRFDFAALKLYFAHLEWALLPKKAVWHRPGDTRGIRGVEAPSC